MIKRKLAKAVILSSLAVSVPVLAGGIKGEAELGFVSTTGNTETETINAKLQLNKETEYWAHEANFGVLSNSQEDQDTGQDETTAEKYTASFKSDRKLDDRSYLYGLATYEDDRFSGFDYQATAGVGYGYKIINNDERKLAVEIGPGYRINAVEDGDDEKEVTLRLGETYDWKFSPTGEFNQFLNVEGGEDNTITRFGVGVKAALNTSLALKVGTVYKYTEEVPADKDHADTETSATITYSF